MHAQHLWLISGYLNERLIQTSQTNYTIDTVQDWNSEIQTNASLYDIHAYIKNL